VSSTGRGDSGIPLDKREHHSDLRRLRAHFLGYCRLGRLSLMTGNKRLTLRIDVRIAVTFFSLPSRRLTYPKGCAEWRN